MPEGWGPGATLVARMHKSSPRHCASDGTVAARRSSKPVLPFGFDQPPRPAWANALLLFAPPRCRLGDDLFVARQNFWNPFREFTAELSPELEHRPDRVLLAGLASVLAHRSRQGPVVPTTHGRQGTRAILPVMGSANLELVRSICAAWGRGDFSSAEWADSEIEYVIADGPSPGAWVGLAGMAEGARTLFGAWENLRAEAEEYHELDSRRVLVLVHNTGRGKTSGVELGRMHAGGAILFELRGGKVTRLVTYWQRDLALAALELIPGAE